MYINTGSLIHYFDITNPFSPLIINDYTPLTPAKTIGIMGNNLLIATSDDLEILDLTVPESPVFLASEPHPDAPNGEYLAIDGSFAILQPYWTTPPTLMQAWPPDNPSVVGPLFDSSFAIKPNMTFSYNGCYFEIYPDGPMRIWDLY